MSAVVQTMSANERVRGYGGERPGAGPSVGYRQVTRCGHRKFSICTIKKLFSSLNCSSVCHTGVISHAPMEL